MLRLDAGRNNFSFFCSCFVAFGCKLFFFFLFFPLCFAFDFISPNSSLKFQSPVARGTRGEWERLEKDFKVFTCRYTRKQLQFSLVFACLLAFFGAMPRMNDGWMSGGLERFNLQNKKRRFCYACTWKRREMMERRENLTGYAVLLCAMLAYKVSKVNSISCGANFF